MNKFMDVIVEIANNNIEVKIIGMNQIQLDGFYKSGTVDVDFNKMTITSRYNEITTFGDWDGSLMLELVWLNKKWHDRSAERSDGWANMHEGWANLFNKYSEN